MHWRGCAPLVSAAAGRLSGASRMQPRGWGGGGGALLAGLSRTVPIVVRSAASRSILQASPAVPAVTLHARPRPLPRPPLPAGLFPNTKSDLGPCEFELHEDHLDWDALKVEYDKLDEREKER